jgi:Transposase DDE domain group 1
MGESSGAEIAVLGSELESFSVDTLGGRLHIRWDSEARATPNAQLAFFAEFLSTAGVYESWIASCPLSYASSSGGDQHKRDVLGTWLLSILAGHHRYSHITGLRGDGVSPQILGMSKIVSEDALRRALSRISADESRDWLRPQLLCSVQAALETPWILDIDTTVKTLFGKQDGAEVSYNPHKPGRPSHALHTYYVGGLRQVLDVVVCPGKQQAAAHARPGLNDILDSLSKQQLPALVRGDCGFGNEPFIADLEKRGQPYLFKLRQTGGVKKMLVRQFARKDWSTPGPSDQGWSAVEDTLKLAGWDRSRRVVILRRAAKSDVALTRNSAEGQMELLLPEQDVEVWEYAVLVTNSGYPLEAMAELYRDRADAENGFDELKNQWGWGGFTTQDIERCQTSARAVALIYNWWSWYCRAAKPEARMEAITSRALLLAAVGRATQHAGQTTLYLTPMHAAKSALMLLIANIRAALSHVRKVAEQSPATDRWKTLLDYIVARIIPRRPRKLLDIGPLWLANCGF